MRKILAVSIIAAILLMTSFVRGADNSPQYFAKVELILSVTEENLLSFDSGNVIEIMPAMGPPGFKYLYMEVSFPEGLPDDIAPLSFDKVVEENGVTKALLTYKDSISLASGSVNKSIPVKVTTYFVHKKWIKLSEGEIKVDVGEVSELYGAGNLTLRVVIDNFAPFAIVGVKSPEGLDLLEVEEQDMLDPDAIRVDFKHLEIDVGKVGAGTYTIIVKRDESFILPNAFVVIEDVNVNLTIGAGATRAFMIRRKNDWRAIGAIVILYSVSPDMREKDAKVLGELIDFVFEKDGVFNIRAASFLIPPLTVSYWIKAYVVYGETFKVVNEGKNPLNIIYIPVLIKEVGEWTPEGLVANIPKNLVSNSVQAFLVVQVPSYGKIESIITPSGDVYDNYKEAVKNWFQSTRSLGILENEAYIQIKSRDALEAGRYVVKINWQPIRVKVTDNSGRPLVGAIVTASGEIEANVETNDKGYADIKLYKPGPYELRVNFRGIEVARTFLGTLVDDEIIIKCSVYDLRVEVTSVLGQALRGADISVTPTEGGFALTAETGEDGVAVFRQLPKGSYEVNVIYKRIEDRRVVELDSDTTLKIQTNVLFELPGFGIPITTFEAFAGVATVSFLGIAFALSRRKSGGEILDKESEDIFLEE